MEFIPKDDILEFNPDTLQFIRKDVNLDKPGEMKEAIDLFEEWVSKQSHFMKKKFSKQYLEQTLISCKGSLEKAKSRLDKLCTLKTLMPHLFSQNSVKDFPDVSHIAAHGLLPKITREGHRVYISKIISSDFDSNMLLNYYKLLILKAEYVKLHDYNNGSHFILDCNNINVLNLVTKLNPLDIRDVITLIVEGYGIRLKGIHILTPSKMVDTLVLFLKQLVCEKIGNRIRVHKTVDTLYDVIPKEILPVEYGGSEMSMEKISNKWLSVLSMEKNVKDLKDICVAGTNEAYTGKFNESYRYTGKFNESYLGMAGSFRTLSVD